MKTGTENYFILSGNHQKSIFHIHMLLKSAGKSSVRAPWNARWFLPMTNSLKDSTSQSCCAPAFVLWSYAVFLSNKQENYFYQIETTSYLLISKHYSINKELHWLKAQHSENEDHGIWSHHSMGNRWGNSGNRGWLYFWGHQNHCRWWLQPWN